MGLEPWRSAAISLVRDELETENPKIRNELSEEEAVLVPFPRSVLAVNFSRPRSIVGNGGYKIS